MVNHIVRFSDEGPKKKQSARHRTSHLRRWDKRTDRQRCISRRVNVIGHKFKIGQRVNYLRRERAQASIRSLSYCRRKGTRFSIG